MSQDLLDDLAEPEAGAEEPTTKRRRLFVVVGAGVVALGALTGFVILPALSGTSSNNSAPLPVHHYGKSATASPTPTAAKASPVPTASVDLALGRDPFKPLLVATTSASASPSASPTSLPTTTPSPTDSSSASTGPGTTTGTLVLQSLGRVQGSDSATVSWNGKVYTVPAGGQFGKTLTFDSQENGTASFHNGSEEFTLQVGETKSF